MAFQRKRKVYKLDFTGTEYDGLEVKVGGLTTGEYLELVGLSAPGSVDDDETGRETERMLRFFTAHLKSWNLEDDGEPVPTTFEGVTSNELAMNMAIINAWTGALTAVSEETEKKSPAISNTADLAQIPTENLS